MSFPSVGENPSAEEVELRFWAAVHSLTGEGRLATFYLMDTSLNRNNWRVTDEALEDALPSLLGKPLGCIPGHRVNHVHEPIQVGRWIGSEKSDGRALATAEVTDEVAWERLRGGEWSPVSVVIKARKVRCSACGRDITGGPDEHIVDGRGHEVIESFEFSRVDFVSEPAYPQAGMVSMGRMAGVASPGVLHLSRSILDGAQGPQGASPEPEGKKEKQVMESRLAQLERELETMSAENTMLKAERQRELVDRALEARFRAGLVKDRVAEAERLRGLDIPILVLLTEDAARVAETMGRTASPGPKAVYAAGGGGDIGGAVEDMRERLFGHRREASNR